MTAFLALLLSTTPPQMTFTDASSGVSMPLDLPGYDVCVIRPKAMRSDEACEGLDPAAADRTLASQVRAAAIARDEEGGTIVTVMVTPGPLSLDESAVNEYLEGVRSGFRQEAGRDPVVRGLAAGAPYDKVTVGGSRFLRYVFELPDEAGTGLNRMLSYSAPTRRAVFSVLLHTSEADIGKLAPAIEKALEGATIPPPDKGPEANRAFEMGRSFGRLVGSLLCLAVICGAAIGLYRLIRGKKTPPAAGAA